MRILGKAAGVVLLAGFLFGMNAATAGYAPGIAHPSGHAHADPLSACVHAISETTYTPRNAAPVVETGPGSPPEWWRCYGRWNPVDSSTTITGLVTYMYPVCPPLFAPGTTVGGQCTTNPFPNVVTTQPGKNAGLPSCSTKNAAPKTGGSLWAPSIGNPINPGTGNKYQEETDYAGQESFPLTFGRMYNSALQAPTEITAIGAHWRHYYHRNVQVINPSSVTASRNDGKDYDFTLQGAVWMPDADVPDKLIRLVDITGNLSGWQYTTADNAVETYDAAGKLILITDPSDRTQSLNYDASGRLIRVTSTFGRTLNFTYDTQNRITTMTDPAGGVYAYGYEANGNLSSVTYPDGKVRAYLYNEPAHTQNTDLPYALTGIIDENGARFATYDYDTQGRAISTEHAGGTDKFTLSYSDNTTAVTDPLGTTRTYTFQTILGVAKNTGVSEPCTTCGAQTSAKTYDTNGNVTRQTDFNGNITTYAYDLVRNLEISRTEAYGTPQARTIATEWHPAFRVPVKITEPNRITTFTYDTQGNLLQKALSSGAQSRAWAYTYNSLGQVLTVDGPRTDVADVTTYSYDTQGNLATITNALGHTTRLTAYDAHGRPLAIQDPNGLITQLVYDPRGRIINRAVGGEITRYQYDAVGQLTRITLSDGSFLNYTYDAAHRLTGMSDALGNTTAYTLDTMSNRIKEEVFDPSGSLTQLRRQVFDSLNRLAQTIGAQNQVTAYGYDANGNLISTTDPLAHTSTQTYDPLNRLVQVTDAAGGVSRFGYDANDRLTEVIDPRSITTAYSHDGLNNLTQTLSLDAGISASTYDSAGNVLTHTDARGKQARYNYDALNRVSRIAYDDNTVTTYQYDSGSNAIGRLSTLTDASGITRWSYDAQGRLTQKSQTAGGVTQRLHYAYDAAGRMTQATYPSGKIIGYGYDPAGNIAQISVNGQPLLDAIRYRPDGVVQSWTWGNGTSHTRRFDQNGQIVSHPLADLSYDAAGRVVLQSQGSNVQSYGYDAVDRLTQYADPQGITTAWSYDANGNRTRLTQGGAITDYAIPVTSNRLIGQSGSTSRSYTYDAAGNLVGDGTFTYIYNTQGRMSRAASLEGKTDYSYNGLGQRVQKVRGNKITSYVYDDGGYLIGEYDGKGRARQETVYLGDIPVVMLRKNKIYYIYSDHLNTPRAIVNLKNEEIWRWDSDPFGVTRGGMALAGSGDDSEEDPDDDGEAFAYNLRFPGQYFDKETGLHYNLFRDYDPGMGRYVQSDPVGLAGGLNTYTYAAGNPVNYYDPDGLSLTSAVVGSSPAICRVNPAACARVGISLPKAPMPAPVAAVVGAGVAGYAVGSMIYPQIAQPLGRVIDTAVKMCGNEEKKRKNCQALKDSILNTCYGLTGRKRMACFEAANTAYRQCMGYE